MGERWSRVAGVVPVRRLDLLVGGDPWAELRMTAARIEAPPVVRVSAVTLRALYAPSEVEVASWPLLPDGGVVTELRSGR